MAKVSKVRESQLVLAFFARYHSVTAETNNGDGFEF